MPTSEPGTPDNMKRAVLSLSLILIIAILGVAALLTPDISAVKTTQGVTVHCEVLGEYPSDIKSIAIIEEKSGQTVWRVKARGPMFQLHKFDVVPGLNAGTIQPFWGNFQVEVPAERSFSLQPGIEYRASVCSADWFALCRSVGFTL